MSEPTDPAREDTDAELWEAQSCVRCDQEFVVRRGGGEVACPHCGAPASLSADRRGPGQFAKLEPPRRQVRSRRKRKVHSEEDLGWEDPEAVERERGGQVSEFLTSTPGVPRGITLKRVRRKKLPDRWQKLTAKLGIWGIGAIVLCGAGLIYFALQQLFVVAATDSDPANRPAPDLGPREETLDEGGVPTIVTPAERADCVAVANRFYAAENLEDRLALVRQPDRVRPLMAAWDQDRQPSGGQIAEVIFEKKRTIGARRFITLAVRFDTGTRRIISFEQPEKGGPVLLDWEVSVGYQPMPLAEFQSAKPVAAVPFRVLVKTGDDYRAPFDDPKKYQCVELSHPGDPDFKLTGYVDRDSGWAGELLAKLEFAATSVILELRFPEDAESDAHVEVVGLAHDSWFY